MDKDKQPTRRVYQRFECDYPAELHAPTARGKPVKGRILDIGMGGAGVESSPELQKGEVYHLHFEAGSVKFRLTGRIVWKFQEEPKIWERAPKIAYYGLNFSLASRQEPPLKALIDELRTKSWPAGFEQSMENYWNL